MKLYKSDLTMISFTGGKIEFTGGLFETDDEALIDMLDKHPRVTKVTTDGDSLEDMTMDELKKLVKENGWEIPKIGDLKKAELLDAIKKAQGEGA